MKAVVAIPTYNEAQNLPGIVARTRRAVTADILVVDDASPDGTGELAEKLAAADSAIHVMHRAGKEGLGKAYLAAFAWAEEHGYTHVVEMDADGSHHPEELHRLLARADEPDHPDLVIGSRYTRGGRIRGWSKARELLSRAGNLYIKVMLGLPVADATAGFRVYRLDTLARIGLDVEASGYFFQTDMTAHVVSHGGTAVEVPITFTERLAGESKLSGAVFSESLRRTTKMGVRRYIGLLKH